MSELARFAVSCGETAERALDYFNGFHDGFMKRIVFESQDRIDEDLSQTCTGMFNVEIDFAHYNYLRGAAPLQANNQIVRAEFRNVQNIFADFRSSFLGNTIMSLSINPVHRQRIGQTGTEQCLELRLARHYYHEEKRQYELCEQQMFTFTDATFVELAAVSE